MKANNFLLVAKKDAQAGGLTRYFTGVACRRGHVAERMVSTRACVECKNDKEKSRPVRVKTRDQMDRRAFLAKQYRKENPKKYKAVSLENYQKHKASRNKKAVDYIRDRRIYDSFYAMKHRIKSLINQILRLKRLSKKSKTVEILGCSFVDFKTHIEKQFLKGMTWENRSLWHIDHIVPISKATCEREVISLCHFTNLRPMWASDNIRKSNKEMFLI